MKPDVLLGDPPARAALLSRADIRIPADRQIVEKYVRDLSPDTEEGRAFAAMFPNYNQMVSDNLITKDRLVSIDERMRQDEATLAWVRQLRADEDWRSAAPTLIRIEERITSYLSEPTHPAPTDGS